MEFLINENTVDILIGLLEKYNLRESDDNYYQKVDNNISTNAEKLADILMWLKDDEIELDDLQLYIKAELGADSMISENLSNDIQKHIIFNRNIDKLPEIQEKKTIKRGNDSYREIIDNDDF